MEKSKRSYHGDLGRTAAIAGMSIIPIMRKIEPDFRAASGGMLIAAMVMLRSANIPWETVDELIESVKPLADEIVEDLIKQSKEQN